MIGCPPIPIKQNKIGRQLAKLLRKRLAIPITVSRYLAIFYVGDDLRITITYHFHDPKRDPEKIAGVERGVAGHEEIIKKLRRELKIDDGISYFETWIEVTSEDITVRVPCYSIPNLGMQPSLSEV
jgi:hypothetical protein